MVEMMNHQEWNSSTRSTLVDVSSFLLFESTGDSEFDSNFYSSSDDLMDSFTLNPSHRRFLEDDDAQSCSYECDGVHDDDDEDEDMDFQMGNNDNGDDDNDNDGDVDSSSCSRSGFNCKNVGWNSDDMEDDDEDEDEDDDEGGVVEQRWINGVNRCKKLKSNVNGIVDSELKSQKDKDKLFWETCLAS